MSTRLKNLINHFSSHTIDALLVVDNPNIRYLTQFPASESWLLVTPSKSFYLTDARYTLEASQRLKGITVVEYAGSLGETVFHLCRTQRIKKVGFDPAHFSLLQYERLTKACPKGIKLIKAPGIPENLRIKKDPLEIKQIRRALSIHHEALREMKKWVKSGVTEWEVFCQLERFVRDRRVGFSFEPNIAAGTNSCFPHARVTQRRIQKNDIVLADFGIDVNGYKSDLTRMFYLGRMRKLVENVRGYVATAQELAIQKIAPGVAVAEVDRAARDYLAKQNLAQYFGHSLGHGVGLEIHEAPRLSQKSKEILEEGMVVTVEPAVYLPGKFGIRLEEMVLVTRKGNEVLSDIDQ